MLDRPRVILSGQNDFEGEKILHKIFYVVLFTVLEFLMTSTSFGQNPKPCASDLSNGVIVAMTGGPVEFTNPGVVKTDMDDFADLVNADPYVQTCSGGRGLISKLLKNQKSNHIHQTKWMQICKALQNINASPIILVGHSNGGAAAVSLARCLEKQNKTVDLLVTADTVRLAGAVRYVGSSHIIPKNVRININTYTKIEPKFFLLPFAIGRSNKTETGAVDQTVVNAGFARNQPGMIAHRNSFLNLAGGGINAPQDQIPLSLLDVSLAVLRGESSATVTALALEDFQQLADAGKFKIKIDVSENGDDNAVKTILKPRPISE